MAGPQLGVDRNPAPAGVPPSSAIRRHHLRGRRNLLREEHGVLDHHQAGSSWCQLAAPCPQGGAYSALIACPTGGPEVAHQALGCCQSDDGEMQQKIARDVARAVTLCQSHGPAFLRCDLRIEQSSLFQHGTGDIEQPVDDRTKGAGMAVTSSSESVLVRLIGSFWIVKADSRRRRGR
jgi:hypothetical protein